MLLKLKSLTINLAFILGLSLIAVPSIVRADAAVCQGFTGASAAQCKNCNSTNPDSVCACYPQYHAGSALSSKQLSSCKDCNSYNGTLQSNLNSQAKVCLKNNQIVNDLNDIINALAGLVGVVCVAMIILGGIQYSLARNNPNDISAARNRIINAIVAMIAFMLIWGLLQYLIPGGVF